MTAAFDRDAALQVLARMVRGEYPADLSLVEIVRTWGDATDDEIAAIAAYEESLP